MESHIIAFLVTLGAGLATGIGSFLAFAAKTTNKTFLSFMLGFSAGVMIYVALVEIFQHAIETLDHYHPTHQDAYLHATVGFFCGVFLIWAIDYLLKEKYGSPHEPHDVSEMENPWEKRRHKLMKFGLFTALAMALHNFPEGIATFIITAHDLSIGIPVALAVAIHNVPEGIAVSILIYHATNSRRKAFWYSFATGLAEPLGAVIGILLIQLLAPEAVSGVIFAIVAGVMVYTALDELLPAAQKYGHHHTSIIGVITGMLLMAASLVIFIEPTASAL